MEVKSQFLSLVVLSISFFASCSGLVESTRKNLLGDDSPRSDKKKNVKVLKEKSEKIAKNTPSKAKDEPAANKTIAKKATVKKTSAKKAPAKKAPAKKAAVKKTSAKKAPAKKAPAKKAAVKKD